MVLTHYEVLGLVGPASGHDSDAIKTAYKRALLLHHPDKSKDETPLFSVDDITRAFKVLSDPTSRADYDREQMLQQARHRLGANADGGDGRGGHTGLETVDLDDLTPLQEDSDMKTQSGEAWYKECRCGRTFIISEAQLEQEAANGELFVPCEGCSLWLKVLFQFCDD